MSPEQARGQELDARSDLFSFGAVLYEMTTGALPFSGRTTGEIMEAIFTREPVPAVRLNPHAPQKLEEIIAKAMEKDRNLRYQSAAEMRTDLLRLKRESNVASRTSIPIAEAARPVAPKKIWPWIAIATTLVILLAAGIYWKTRPVNAPLSVNTSQKSETSIAVLPFVNMSGDKDQEYFSDGLTEELLNLLAKIPELRDRANFFVSI
jgi:serine/threonine protein kinase